MNTVIVSDIFGTTPGLKALATALDASCIIDPYCGVEKHFKDETDAYRYFSEHVGLERYLQHLVCQVGKHSDELILIGFSIGAAAIWRLSAMPMTKQIKSAVCFYGSQIRHFADITPRFAIELVFPRSEPHFDVDSLQRSCAMKANTRIRQVDYLHGFMNSHSVNFDQHAYQRQLATLRSQLQLQQLQIHYRLATIDDTDALASLHAQSWRETYRGIFTDHFLDHDVFQERHAAWMKRFTEPKKNQRIMLAMQGKQICGFICAFTDQHAEWGTFIDNLHVASAFQGKGVGKQLILLIAQWIEKSCTPQGIYLEVLEDNLNARQFYSAIDAVQQQSKLWLPPGSDTKIKDLIYRWPSHTPLLALAR